MHVLHQVFFSFLFQMKCLTIMSFDAHYVQIHTYFVSLFPHVLHFKDLSFPRVLVSVPCPCFMKPNYVLVKKTNIYCRTINLLELIY